MRIYVVRHGETDWNIYRRLQGRSDIPLNARGIEEAGKTGEGLKDVSFEAIYVSPLYRARQTAQLLKRDRDIPVYVDDRLVEMGFGIYEGMSAVTKEYLVPDPDFADLFFHHPDRYVPPEGGESFYDVCARTQEFLGELASKKEYQDKTVLVVTHGAAIRGLLNGVCFGGDIKRFWGEGVMKNCEVTILGAEEGKVSILEGGLVYYDL